MSTAPVLMFSRSPHRAGSRSGRPTGAASQTSAGRTGAVRRPVCGELSRVQARRATDEMAFYRKYTEGMLRRYVRMSMESGRVPSMLGRELFRGRVTSYQVHSFEDVVIFVCDVENCVKKLNEMGQRLITRIGMQEYTHAEAAGMVGMSERSVARRYYEALDELTALFLERGLLVRHSGAAV